MFIDESWHITYIATDEESCFGFSWPDLARVMPFSNLVGVDNMYYENVLVLWFVLSIMIFLGKRMYMNVDQP